jgi:4-hydroxy-tetrahydrodipicolinate reductase
VSTSAKHKIAVAGASGRMGQLLIEAIAASPDCVLVGASDIAASPAIGQDALAFKGQQSAVAITADLNQALANADAFIDFTRPAGTMAHAEACAARGIKLVVGTTGFSPEELARLKALSEKTAMVIAPNMSVGVNVTLKLLEAAAKLLQDGYDIEIIEAHHHHKVDAPSGTALKMGEVIAKAQGTELKDRAVLAREGHTGARSASEIGFATIRGGDIVGDHTVLFAGDGERIEISHKAASRKGYGAGSLKAVRFLSSRQTGLFDMFDVLGLKEGA